MFYFHRQTIFQAVREKIRISEEKKRKCAEIHLAITPRGNNHLINTGVPPQLANTACLSRCRIAIDFCQDFHYVSVKCHMKPKFLCSEVMCGVQRDTRRLTIPLLLLARVLTRLVTIRSQLGARPHRQRCSAPNRVPD